MPQLPRRLVKDRAARLRAKGESARDRHLDSLKGSRQMVLMERGGIGHTPCFAGVAFAGAVPGTFLPLTITGRAGSHLTGIPA